jgi:hypothetical protein
MSATHRVRDDRPGLMRHLKRYLPAVVLAAVTLIVVAAVISAAAGTYNWPVRGVLAVYFPSFLVLGSPDRKLVGLGVFLILAAYLLFRCRYWAALATLVIPIALTWVFAGTMMRD